MVGGEVGDSRYSQEILRFRGGESVTELSYGSGLIIKTF